MLTRFRIETPVGPMVLVTDEAQALWAAEFHDDAGRIDTSLRRFGIGPTQAGAGARDVADAFAGWFAGDLSALDDLVLPDLGSPFERAVWAALRRIPAGETRSYGQIARTVGGTANPRAVGTANGRNPRAIVVPCHRVIGSDGGLTGYAGGLDRKAWLLAHEGWSPVQTVLFA